MEVKPKADYLFESSWEVCNKVGGIHTVIVSKAKLMKEAYKNYFLVGPYFENNARFAFEERKPPKEFKKAFNELKKEGIQCHFGEWQVKGNPFAILVDFKKFSKKKNDLKSKYWEDYKIDSLNSGWDFEEPMIWATAVGMLLEKLKSQIKKPMVAHFHEWLAGISLLYLRSKKVDIKTVFTTHATMLGRAIAGNNRNLYDELKGMDPETEAVEIKVQDKFMTERACAHNAHVLTTVSEITALELEKLLGRKPDVLVMNGLDNSEFPTHEEAAIQHRKNKRAIYDFINYFFFPYYQFDLEQTLFFFIAGRYEYRNKGIDIFIKSLGRLNEQLKQAKSKKTVVAFFFIPRGVQRVKLELSESKLIHEQMKDVVEQNTENIEETIMNQILMSSNMEVENSKLFDKVLLTKIKKLKLKFKKSTAPLLSTHDFKEESSDLILKGFSENNLLNREKDKVKVIDYPIYLTGVDGLLDLSYFDTLNGCHFGIFPSYYEPWGYTPLESAALSIPSLTTDLSGFGRFILSKNIKSGLFVLKRFERPEGDILKEFTKILFDFSKLSKKGRVQQKIDAKKVAELADWKEFLNNYIKAHNLALER